MTLDEINEQIAQLMQEKAEDQALAHYVAPRASSRFDYIINGDRSGLDKFDASEQAYATMLAKQRMANDEAYKQRMFNELSKEADRLNTLKIADKAHSDKNDVDKVARIQKELGFADAEVQMAKDNLDITNPESVRNYRKAVLNRKYWAAQLPSEFGVDINDYEYTEPTESSPKVIVNNTKKELRALLGLGKSNWTDSQKARYKELFDKIPSDDPEKVDFEVKLANKGKTTNETERAEYNKLSNKLKSGKLLTSGETKRYNLLKPKYGK